MGAVAPSQWREWGSVFKIYMRVGKLKNGKAAEMIKGGSDRVVFMPVD